MRTRRRRAAQDAAAAEPRAAEPRRARRGRALSRVTPVVRGEAIGNSGELDVLDCAGSESACGWVLGCSGAAPTLGFQRSRLPLQDWHTTAASRALQRGSNTVRRIAEVFLSVWTKFSLDNISLGFQRSSEPDTQLPSFCFFKGEKRH